MAGDLSTRWHHAWRLIFAVTLLAALVVALLPPGEERPDWFPQADKLRHALAFMALWWVGSHVRWRSPWVLAILLLAFGILIELAQRMTGYRVASMGDVLADLIGIGLGAACWRLPQASQPTT